MTDNLPLLERYENLNKQDLKMLRGERVRLSVNLVSSATQLRGINQKTESCLNNMNEECHAFRLRAVRMET